MPIINKQDMIYSKTKVIKTGNSTIKEPTKQLTLKRMDRHKESLIRTDVRAFWCESHSRTNVFRKGL